MNLITLMEGITMVKKLASKRSVERGVRTAGSVGAISLASFYDLIPAQYQPWAIALVPVISLVFKELRMRYPDNKFLKGLPL